MAAGPLGCGDSYESPLALPAGTQLLCIAVLETPGHRLCVSQVERCMISQPHAWKYCPFVHHQEPIKRRHPTQHTSQLCPLVKKVCSLLGQRTDDGNHQQVQVRHMCVLQSGLVVPYVLRGGWANPSCLALFP